MGTVRRDKGVGRGGKREREERGVWKFLGSG